MTLAAWHAPSPAQVDQSWRSTNASWAGANFRVSIESGWEGAMTIRTSLGRSCPATTTPQYFTSSGMEEIKMSARPSRSLNLGDSCYIGCPSRVVVEVFRSTHSFPPPIQRIPTTSSGFYANNSPMPHGQAKQDLPLDSCRKSARQCQRMALSEYWSFVAR